jgi:hypothetical protein
VLGIQDTTDLDFSHFQQTSGLGFINQSQQPGIKVLSRFAVSGDGAPLGLLHQHCWSRKERSGKRGERRKKATCDKESGRWLDTVTAEALVLGQHTIELKRKPHRAARPSTIKVEPSVMKQERSNVVLHFE